MTIIRAEIRKWRLGSGAVSGKIFKDTKDVWDDGDEVVFIDVRDVMQCPNFKLVQTTAGIFKLEDDEELKT